MIVRAIRPEEKTIYNAAVRHPLQAWEWGEFRQATGLKVERIGFFEHNKLLKGFQVTFHPVPFFPQYTIGYFPKGDMPDEYQLAALRELGKQHNALFIKMEPNIGQKVGLPSAHESIKKFLLDNGAVGGRPLFTKYTFQLDLQHPLEKLFANLSSKTRYNVNLSQRKGVVIQEDSSADGVTRYLAVLAETTKRQGFYAHGPAYFEKMWAHLGQSGLLRVFHAVHEGDILASWMMFVFNGILYYPYGASSSKKRDLMASNLMMWEMIRLGHDLGCTSLDMWGSLGPEPDPKDPWYGFHRFKKGYGGDLVEFIGSFDLVLRPTEYKLFQLGDTLRWKFLRLKARLGR